MKANMISKENGEAKLTMDFTAEELEEAVIKVYKRTKDRYPVDGFRKGKAPRSIIEKRYGENVFVEDAITDLFNAEYPKAVQELELAVIDSPRIEFSEIKKGEAFTATVTVAVYPDVEVKDYKGIEVEKVTAEVTDEDVDNELAMMQNRAARMVTVDREAKEGDTVVIDYKGFVGEEQFEGGTAEAYSLKLGSGSFIPGFEDQLIGTKKDDEKDVVVTFPEEYHADDLAGKEAVFKCKVHEVKEEEKPELDDEFAKDTSEFDTLDELKESVRGDVEKRKTAQAENQMKDKVIEKFVEANELDVPDVMVQDEVDAMIRESQQQLSMQGIQLEQYLQMLGKEMADFREDIKDEAGRRVKTRMLVQAVVEAEDIQATEEEVNEQLEVMAIQYQMDAEKVREMLGEANMVYLESDIKMRKAIDFMYDNAVFTEPKEEPAEAGAALRKIQHAAEAKLRAAAPLPAFFRGEVVPAQHEVRCQLLLRLLQDAFHPQQARADMTDRRPLRAAESLPQQRRLPQAVLCQQLMKIQPAALRQVFRQRPGSVSFLHGDLLLSLAFLFSIIPEESPRFNAFCKI